MALSLVLKKKFTMSSVLTSAQSVRCVSILTHISARFFSQTPPTGIATWVPEKVPTLMEFDLTTLNQDIYKAKIESLINLSPFEFKGFRCLPPIIPESKNAYFDVLFKHENKSFLALYGRFSLLPLAIKSGRYIYVLNTEVFKHVPDSYSDPTVFTTVERNHSLFYFESKLSRKLLLDSFEVIASWKPSEDVSLSSALSRLILLTSYSCFLAEMREVYEYLFVDPSAEFEIPDNIINQAKNWGFYCRQIHLGVELFEMQGKELTLDDMRNVITLLNSKREARQLKLPPAEEKWVGEIISRFEKKGFTLKGLKLITVDQPFAEKHYADLSAKPFFRGLVDYVVSGPVCAMVWEGKNVVTTGRKIIGATNPAAPGTIRGDFAIDIGRNVIHGSDAVESARKEIALWFPEGIAEWQSSLHSWIYE